MVTPATLYVSSTREDPLTVRNVGTEPLVVHAVHLPSDFSTDSAVPFIVPPGGVEMIGVTFTGSRNWTNGPCSIDHSGDAGTTSVTLSGVVGTVLGSERLPRTLSAEMSPYHILSSFHLPAGDTLALEPGVRLRFVTSDSMFVEGVVTADGTASRPCAIEGASWEWSGISVSGAGSVALDYTTIEGGRHRTHGGGMRITAGANATLRSCTIRDNRIAADAYYPTGGGVYVGGEGTTATFLNCTIEDNGARYWNHHGGWITVRGSGGGVYVGDNASALLRGCWIRGNTAGLSGSAISASSADVVLESCILTGNAIDAGATEYRFEPTTIDVRDTHLAVRNCTIARNIYDRGDWAAIRAAGSSTAEISGTVVWEESDRGPGLELALYDESVTGTTIAYSDFASQRPGAGNISADPLFVDPANGDFRLQPASPCIDAGDPARIDADGSRSDIGAIPFGEEWPPLRVKQTTVPTRFTLHQNRPNPFNPTTRIAFSLPEPGGAQLTVYDVTGRAVRTLADGSLGSGVHTVVWDGVDDAGRPCASGAYVYRLMVSGGSAASAERRERSETRRMLLLR